MSKDLYLIRHSLAAEREPKQNDIDRFLSSEGIQTATRTGHHFKQEGIIPDIIISSPAIRAQSTSMLIAEQIKYNTDLVHINDELYEASVRTLLQVINRLKETWERVFIVGHNPSISYLAEYITHAEIGSIVPGGYVHIEVKLEKWELLSEGNGDFISYKDPLTYNF